MADGTTTTPRIDTSDMVRIHLALRAAFGAAAPLVGSVAPGDTARAEVVGTFYANVLEFLRVHHESEDALLWPRLIERVPEQADMVRRVAAQHEGIHESLLAVQEQLARWRENPQIDSGAQLAAALATLGATLSPHLDEEERVILPLAAQHLTEEEWREFPSHAMMNFSGDKLWLVMGLVREQFTVEQNAEMDAGMPPPVLEFWQTVGQPQYEAFVTELRG
jgi:iron-sulfur cluster repair protein YtfE (RIC family)